MVGMSVRGKAGFVRPTATRINRLTPVPDISMEDIIQDASEGESTDYDSDTVEASNPPTARGSDPEDVFSDTDVDELSEEDRSSATSPPASDTEDGTNLQVLNGYSGFGRTFSSGDSDDDGDGDDTLRV